MRGRNVPRFVRSATTFSHFFVIAGTLSLLCLNPAHAQRPGGGIIDSKGFLDKWAERQHEKNQREADKKFDKSGGGDSLRDKADAAKAAQEKAEKEARDKAGAALGSVIGNKAGSFVTHHVTVDSEKNSDGSTKSRSVGVKFDVGAPKEHSNSAPGSANKGGSSSGSTKSSGRSKSEGSNGKSGNASGGKAGGGKSGSKG